MVLDDRTAGKGVYATPSWDFLAVVPFVFFDQPVYQRKAGFQRNGVFSGGGCRSNTVFVCFPDDDGISRQTAYVLYRA